MTKHLPVIQAEKQQLDIPNAVQTAGDLCRDSIFVDAETNNKQVYDLFENNTALLNIPVVRSGDVVGLINRDKFMRSMARRFHWELYANKRCSKMMDEAPLTVEAETTINDLADQLLGERNSYRLSDGFVIKRGKKLLGTGLTSDVLAAILFIQKLLTTELVRANERLRELSITDPLTGLHNRRHFNEILAHEIRRSRREGQTLALFMLDIDYFKKLNDKLGHQAGDETLKQVANTLRNNLRRPSDYCFRVGGEEFAVLVTGGSESTIAELAETLRSKIEALQLSNPDHPLGIVTISAGVAIAPATSTVVSADDIYAKADQALYEAKGNGRNRVAVATAYSASS